MIVTRVTGEDANLVAGSCFIKTVIYFAKEIRLWPQCHDRRARTSGNAGDENFSFLEALIAVLEECKDKTEANGSFIVAATIAITEGKQFKASPKDTAVPAWSKMKDHGKTLAKATKAAHLAATLMLLKNGIESDTLFNQNKKPILQYKDISVKSQPKNLKNEDWALLKEADAWVCEGGIKEAPRGADQNNIPKYKLEIVTTGSRTEKKFVEMNWQ
ncbi:hypothetical protein N7488_005995 [Penicillium malachiteum]|nr:hypothetical protein N7488_005995 [Penicillium malachiteum]